MELSTEDIALVLLGRLEITDQTMRYYDEHGEYQRDGGPAIVWCPSSFKFAPKVQIWYQHGQRHRSDGPAWNRS